MNEYIGKTINYGSKSVTGKVDFLKPLVLDIPKNKTDDVNQEIEKYIKLVDEIKNNLWMKISTSNDKRYSEALMLMEDPTFSNDIKRLIKKNKMTAEAAIFITASKFKNMYAEISNSSMNNKTDLIKYIEYLFNREFLGMEYITKGNPDSIYIIESLSLYNVTMLSDLQPKGIIVKESSEMDLIELNDKFVNSPIISLEGNNMVFNEFVYGEEIRLEPNENKIIFNTVKEEKREIEPVTIESKKGKEYITVFSPVVVEKEIEKVADNSKQRNEIIKFDNSQISLATYVNNIFKIKDTKKDLVINTNRLFLEKEPTIEEQISVYSNVINSNKDQELMFVLFNVDSLNKPNWLDYGSYINDLLVKGIRLSYLNQDLFVNQIKSLLISAKNTKNEIKILLPLVSTNEELVILKEEIAEIAKELVSQGIEIGKYNVSLILEAPSMGFDLSEILKDNNELVLDLDELTQYLLAIEKNNQLFNHLYQPLNPAVLKFVNHMVKQMKQAGAKLFIQGDSVNNPEVFVALIGIGAKNIVVSHHFADEASKLAEKFNNIKTSEMIAEVIKFKTSNDVNNAIELFLEK